MSTRTDRRGSRVAASMALALLLLSPPVVGRATTSEDDEVRALLAAPLTAETAVRIASIRQLRLRAAALDVDAARARRRQAGLLPNPEVKLDMRRPGASRDSQQGDVEVEYDLGEVLLIPVRRSIADADVEVAGLEADRSRVRLAHEVRAAFYAVQAAERRWRSAVLALETAVAARDAGRALHAAGNVHALELARHEATSEVMRVEVAELELAYHDAREGLQRRLGLQGAETRWQVASESAFIPEEPPDLADVERRALESNRELARLRAEISSRAGSQRLARLTGWLPELAVDVHAERDERQWEVGGGVRVRVPFFDRRQGETAALRADLRALESRLRAKAVDLRSQARAARNRVISSQARARHWRERVLPTRRRVVEQTLLQHNAMQANVFDLLEARRAEAEAERAANDAWFESLVALCALDALLEGAPIEAGARADGDSLESTDETRGGI